MNANIMPLKILREKINTKGIRSRLKLRWFDIVREDFRILKVKEWGSTAMDRDAWRLLVKEA
jgi:hypothetical protein